MDQDVKKKKLKSFGEVTVRPSYERKQILDHPSVLRTILTTHERLLRPPHLSVDSVTDT
jgi:hypothetical protein